MEIRKLDPADLALLRDLSDEAWGSPSSGPPPAPRTEVPPGQHYWGAFDGGRLVANALALEFSSWFGGVAVPTCGVASVAVAAEHRGGGLLARLFEPMLAESVARGEVLSTLYPTANGIYRPMGYEHVTSYDVVEIPTAELGRMRPPASISTRRATAADVPAVKAVYDTWAAAQNGPLTRTGLRFPTTDEELVDEFTGITLAVDTDDRVGGYASWDRRGGYGLDGVLRVWDLLALSADAYRALWAVAASFASVTGSVSLRTSGADPARLVVPTATWANDASRQHPYSLRVSDVAGAFTAIAPGLPGLTGEVPFSVVGDPFGVTDGHYLLTLGEGTERVTSSGGPTYTTQGIALAFAGTQSSANLRLLGHLTGPDTHDRVLDAVLGGRQVHVRDYF